MAVYDILPYTDLKGVDVRDTLGAGSDDLTDFFDAGIINWCSKYKPVIYPSNFVDSDYRWKGADGMCGMTVSSVSSYSQIPSKYDGDMNGWAYNVPYGGASAPLRLGDFRGYCHTAYPMISDFYVPDRVSNQSGGSFNATAMVASDNDRSITLANLALSSCYSGVVVTDMNGNVMGAVLGLAVSGGAFSVLVRCSSLNMSAGTYMCYPMLANAYPLSSAGKFYTLPNVRPKQITVTTSYFAVAVMAERGSGNSVSYTITINNTSTAVTWTNNAFKLRFADKEFEDALVSGEKSGSLEEPITVPANGSLTLTGTITGISSTLFSESVMRLWVSFNNGYEIQDAFIVDNTRE